jgi:hypothetical protein
MACCSQILTAGILRGCETNTGGVKHIYITDYCNVTGITLDGDNLITDIAMATGTFFYEFQAQRDTAMMDEPATINLQNGTSFWATSVGLTIARRDNVKRAVIELLFNKKLAVIVEDQNGNFYYVGKENGADLTEVGGGTGAAKGDLNGYTLKVTAEEPKAAYFVDSAIVSALVA